MRLEIPKPWKPKGDFVLLGVSEAQPASWFTVALVSRFAVGALLLTAHFAIVKTCVLTMEALVMPVATSISAPR